MDKLFLWYFYSYDYSEHALVKAKDKKEALDKLIENLPSYIRGYISLTDITEVVFDKNGIMYDE